MPITRELILDEFVTLDFIGNNRERFLITLDVYSSLLSVENHLYRCLMYGKIDFRLEILATLIGPISNDWSKSAFNGHAL